MNAARDLVISSAPDLSDPAVFMRGEHDTVLAWLRSNAPVFWNPTAEGPGFWALTKYEDVLAAYRDHASYSSSGGAIVGGSFRSEADTAGGRMLVASDLPRHRLLRQQVQPAFFATMLKKVSQQVRVLVDRAVDRMIVDGGADFATEVAPELPAGALMALMAIGHGDAHALIDLTRKMIGFRDPAVVDMSEDERLRLALLQSDIFEYFADLVRERRRALGDDLISILLRAEVNGRRLPEEDVLVNCMNFAVGGNETSSHSTSAGVLALTQYPAEYRRMLDDPSVFDSALEEILRWSSTNAYVQRIATRDVEIRGELIRAGDAVTLWNVSANRDEDYFTDPHRFDVGRTPNRHLTFGNGIHRCIGSAVANVEMSALFGRLVADRLQLEAAGPARRLCSNFILGFTTLPVRVIS